MNRIGALRPVLLTMGAAALGLAACSGGGSTATTPTTASAPTSTSASAAPSTTTTVATTSTVPGAFTAITGELTWTDKGDKGPRSQAFTYALANDGSWRIKAKAPAVTDFAYDAKARRWADHDEFNVNGLAVNVPPGPPDFRAENPYLDEGIAANVVAQATAGKTTSETLIGRPAWRFHAQIPPNESAGEPLTDVDAWVDQRTHLLLRVVDKQAGAVVRQLEVASLTEAAPADRSQFTLPAKGASADDERWSTTTVAAARRSTPFVPLAAPSPPPGYGAPLVSLARKANATGPEASNPGDLPAVAFTYRRGLDVINVTTRASGKEPQWSDPFGYEGGPSNEQTVRLKAGPLAGSDAHVDLSIPYPPHLFVVQKDRVVTISGPLSSAELVALAETLQPPTP